MSWWELTTIWSDLCPHEPLLCFIAPGNENAIVARSAKLPGAKNEELIVDERERHPDQRHENGPEDEECLEVEVECHTCFVTSQGTCGPKSTRFQKTEKWRHAICAWSTSTNKIKHWWSVTSQKGHSRRIWACLWGNKLLQHAARKEVDTVQKTLNWTLCISMCSTN